MRGGGGAERGTIVAQSGSIQPDSQGKEVRDLFDHRELATQVIAPFIPRPALDRKIGTCAGCYPGCEP